MRSTLYTRYFFLYVLFICIQNKLLNLPPQRLLKSDAIPFIFFNFTKVANKRPASEKREGLSNKKHVSNKWFFCDWIIFGGVIRTLSRWSSLEKTVNGFKLLTIFGNRLHFRCLTGFWINLCVSCELRGVSWFKFSSWLPIYSSFTKND